MAALDGLVNGTPRFAWRHAAADSAVVDVIEVGVAEGLVGAAVESEDRRAGPALRA